MRKARGQPEKSGRKTCSIETHCFLGMSPGFVNVLSKLIFDVQGDVS